MTLALVACLGLNPSVLTTSLYALAHEGIDIRQLTPYIITTKRDSEMQRCLGIVETFLDRTWGISARYFEADCEDIKEPADASNFQRELNRLFYQVEKNKHSKVFVTIAGGRKTMSALTASTAQLHKVDALYDLWVARRLEILAETTPLRDVEYSLNQNQAIPVLAEPSKDEYALVNLPLVPLYNLGQRIHEINTLELMPAQATNQTEISIALDREHIEHILAISPGRLNYQQAEDFEQLLRRSDDANENIGKQLRQFLEREMLLGLPGELQKQLNNSQQIQADELQEQDLLAWQEFFAAQDFDIEYLPELWLSRCASISKRYGDKLDIARILLSLFREIFKVGYRVHPLSAAERALVKGKKVFISYKHGQKEIHVERIVNWLKEAGFDVWWDKDILAGEAWNTVIDSAIRDSYACVFCVTEVTLNSGFIRDFEFSHFVNQRRLVPVILDGTEFYKLAAISPQLAQIQGIDYAADAELVFHKIKTALIEMAK